MRGDSTSPESRDGYLGIGRGVVLGCRSGVGNPALFALTAVAAYLPPLPLHHYEDKMAGWGAVVVARLIESRLSFA